MKMVERASVWLQNLWDKTRNNCVLCPGEPAKTSPKITRKDHVIWSFLILTAYIYQLIFYIVKCVKQSRRKHKAQVPVISVGNISVGGTGKSVFVRFLMQQCARPAILLRGYGRINESKAISVLVSDGNTIFTNATISGDEAYMLAQELKGPVVVGKIRAASCKLLEKYVEKNQQKISHIILDDAYQHHSLYKDCEILLLDARYPFENSYCLPAGRLREKDVSRSNLIVLTHTDKISPQKLDEVRFMLAKKTGNKIVLTGKHQVAGVFKENQDRAQPVVLQEQSFFVFAGVGSWSSFLASVAQAGIAVGGQRMFADHHHYTLLDIKKIIELMHEYGLQHVLTTEKDWVKIKPLLSNNQFHATFSWYVLRIEFAFLSQQERDIFMAITFKN